VFHAIPWRRRRIRFRSYSLCRYFTRLEKLFAHHEIGDDLEKKTHTTSFLECDLAEDWEALPEFSDEKKTYLDFKSRLFDLYNLNIPRYNICDLKRLVSGHFGSSLDLLTHSRHQEGDMCRT
jgi:hypothetical protein